MMKKSCLTSALLLFAVATAVGACGGKDLPPQSAIVSAPHIRPGSTWTYRVTDSTDKQPRMETLTFEREDVYKNASVLAFNSGNGETRLTDRDLNFVAAVTSDRVLREASPSFRSFDFPFYVGKEWRSVFTYQDNARSLSWSPVEVHWKTKEYDVVKVPAGQFRAFRLISEPRTNWAQKDEVWYAPEVLQVVRWKFERTSAHYRGKGRETGELVQYALK
jgi:hypothetical protein